MIMPPSNQNVSFALKQLNTQDYKAVISELRHLAAAILRRDERCSLRPSDLFQEALQKHRSEPKDNELNKAHARLTDSKNPTAAKVDAESVACSFLEAVVQDHQHGGLLSQDRPQKTLIYEAEWEDKKNFLAFMSQVMKTTMQDYVRKRYALKRQRDPNESIGNIVPQDFMHNHSPETIANIDQAVQKRPDSKIFTLDDLHLTDLIKTAELVPEQAEIFFGVLETLESKKPEWAQLIKLRDYLQIPWKHIAEQFDSSEDAVRKKHARAFAWVKAEVLHQLNVGADHK